MACRGAAPRLLAAVALLGVVAPAGAVLSTVQTEVGVLSRPFLDAKTSQRLVSCDRFGFTDGCSCETQMSRMMVYVKECTQKSTNRFLGVSTRNLDSMGLRQSYRPKKCRLTISSGTSPSRAPLRDLVRALNYVYFTAEDNVPYTVYYVISDGGVWDYNFDNQHFYQVNWGDMALTANQSMKTWIESANLCAERPRYGMTGYLTSLTSPEETEFVKRMTWTNRKYWVGLSDMDTGVWQWISGQEGCAAYYAPGPNHIPAYLQSQCEVTDDAGLFCWEPGSRAQCHPGGTVMNTGGGLVEWTHPPVQNAHVAYYSEGNITAVRDEGLVLGYICEWGGIGYAACMAVDDLVNTVEYVAKAIDECRLDPNPCYDPATNTTQMCRDSDYAFNNYECVCPSYPYEFAIGDLANCTAPTPAPPTPSPPTPVPPTPVPPTPVPPTPVPPTPVPPTPVPPTPVPPTPVPPTPVPPTPVPPTPVPPTPVPPTPVPPTPVPPTPVPPTPVPPTPVPPTPVPPTPVPPTPVPPTPVPPTPVPPTPVPPTPLPPSPAPSTPAPRTPVPPTPLPPTPSPSTEATPAPPTPAPTTPAPPTPVPSTPAPTSGVPRTLMPQTFPPSVVTLPPLRTMPTQVPMPASPPLTEVPRPPLAPMVAPTLAPPTDTPTTPAPELVPRVTRVPPPTPPPSSVVRAAATEVPAGSGGLSPAKEEVLSTAGAGASAAMLVSGAGAGGAGRLALLRGFGCDMDDVDLGFDVPLDFEFHPTGVAIGGGKSRYLVGACVMNILLVVAFYVACIVCAKLVALCDKGSMEESLAIVRTPGAVIIPYMFLLPGTSMAAARLVFFWGTSGGWAVVGGLAILTCCASPIVLYRVVLQHVHVRAHPALDMRLFPAEHVAMAKVDGEPIPKLLTGWPRRIYTFAFGTHIWVNVSEDGYFCDHYGGCFDSYREGECLMLLTEVGVNIFLSFMSVWKPGNEPECHARNSCISVVFALYFAAVVARQPFSAALDNMCATLIAGMTAMAMMAMTIGIGLRSAEDGFFFTISMWCLLLSALLVMAKGVWDLALCITDVCLNRRVGARRRARLQAAEDRAADMQFDDPGEVTSLSGSAYAGSDPRNLEFTSGLVAHPSSPNGSVRAQHHPLVDNSSIGMMPSATARRAFGRPALYVGTNPHDLAASMHDVQPPAILTPKHTQPVPPASAGGARRPRPFAIPARYAANTSPPPRVGTPTTPWGREPTTPPALNRSFQGQASPASRAIGRGGVPTTPRGSDDPPSRRRPSRQRHQVFAAASPTSRNSISIAF